MEQCIRSPSRLRGTVVVPGDKSISHRAAILNALALGPARVENFLVGEDTRATLDCLGALGVSWSLEEDGGLRPILRIHGPGRAGLHESEDVLDARNSGTTMRLLSGVLAARPFLSILTGDSSLRSRPMGRVVEPLREMGAQVWGRGDGAYPPLAIRGGELRGIGYRMPVASAQVKSALLLAGLLAQGETAVEESAPTRDHTERMLRAMGARLSREGGLVRIEPLEGELSPLDLRVPGDVSAAAFWMVAAAVHPDAELHLPGVGVNPTRSGVIDVLRSMGAELEVREEREQGGEPVADITVRSSRLAPVEVGGDLVPRLIDEIPVLAVAAALTPGRTVVRDAAELRVKESDRIVTTCRELRRLGARVEELPDGLAIDGVEFLTGARCQSHDDHRLAMALGVAGLLARGETVIEGAGAAEVSYPSFWSDLACLASSAAGGPASGEGDWVKGVARRGSET
jgi:3-phosphoshikimate 1-carboxyvinyltransferase